MIKEMFDVEVLIGSLLGAPRVKLLLRNATYSYMSFIHSFFWVLRLVFSPTRQLISRIRISVMEGTSHVFMYTKNEN